MADITDEIASLTRRLHAYRVFRPERGYPMERITEKFARAGGVVKRVTTHIETKLDELIAREAPIKDRMERALEPHHAHLDADLKDLDAFERQISQIENAPLAESGGDERLPPLDPPGYNKSV